MLRPNFFSLILLCGVAFAAPRAYPISRVGNSVIADPELGFQVDIPANFFDVRNLSDGAVRLTSPFAGGIFFAPTAMSQATLDLYPLGAEYPNLPNGRRVDALQYFQSLGAAWTQVKTTDPCILALTATNSGTTTTILAWGDRKGIVIVGAPESRVTAALGQLVGSLRLDQGTCAWK